MHIIELNKIERPVIPLNKFQGIDSGWEPFNLRALARAYVNTPIRIDNNVSEPEKSFSSKFDIFIQLLE